MFESVKGLFIRDKRVHKTDYKEQQVEILDYINLSNVKYDEIKTEERIKDFPQDI